MNRILLVCCVLSAVALSACKSNTKTTEPVYQPPESSRRFKAAAEGTAKARELIEEGKYDEAESLLKRALALDVMYGPAHNNLGLVYYHQNKLYPAAWEFQYAIKLMPNHPEPKNNLGLVYEKVGRINEAVEEYSKAAEIEPDNAQFLGNLARARIRRGDKDEETRQLLNDLILKDRRPEWVTWAQERLVRMTPADKDLSKTK